jgi:hypothetical protein
MALHVPILFLLVFQYLRPTLLNWIILTLAFLGYSVAVCARWRGLNTDERLVFLAIGLGPFVMLLWARPRTP